MGRERVRNPGKCPVCGAGLYYDAFATAGDVDGGYFISCSSPEHIQGDRAHYAALWWSKEYESEAIVENWSIFGPEAVFRDGWPE